MPRVAAPTVRLLSASMKAGSAAEHAAAEGSPFVSALLAGQVTAERYASYLLRLRVVYRALEGAVRAHRNDPVVAAVYDPALERARAIDGDLEHWSTDGSRDVDSPAAVAIAERIEALPWSGSLVAHHYTRYLGDLSGGQAIGRGLNRAFALGGVGLAFYRFPMRPKPYKDRYRARLDALNLDDAHADRIVEEVKLAFRLNRALLDELAGDAPTQ